MLIEREDINDTEKPRVVGRLYKVSFASKRDPPEEDGIDIDCISLEWRFRDNNAPLQLDVELRETVRGSRATVTARVLYESSLGIFEDGIDAYVASYLDQIAEDGMAFPPSNNNRKQY